MAKLMLEPYNEWSLRAFQKTQASNPHKIAEKLPFWKPCVTLSGKSIPNRRWPHKDTEAIKAELQVSPDGWKRLELLLKVWSTGQRHRDCLGAY